MKHVKGIPRWFLLKLKLFKFKMKQSKISWVFFSDFVSVAKHMFYTLTVQKVKDMCSEISKNVLSKIQKKEPNVANQITLKFLN